MDVSRLVREKRRGPELNASERRALQKIRLEGRGKGAALTTNGKGGLPPSLVLHVFRRDEWRCKRCGCDGNGRGGLTMHHKAGVVASRWLDEKGHSNDPNNLVTMCKTCHTEVHTEARAQGIDSTQIKPLGDLSDDKRAAAPDHGLPWRR